MIGCDRCGHTHDYCECKDVDVIGQDRDMFEAPVKDLGSHIVTHSWVTILMYTEFLRYLM